MGCRSITTTHHFFDHSTTCLFTQTKLSHLSMPYQTVMIHPKVGPNPLPREWEESRESLSRVDLCIRIITVRRRRLEGSCRKLKKKKKKIKDKRKAWVHVNRRLSRLCGGLLRERVRVRVERWETRFRVFRRKKKKSGGFSSVINLISTLIFSLSLVSIHLSQFSVLHVTKFPTSTHIVLGFLSWAPFFFSIGLFQKNFAPHGNTVCFFSTFGEGEQSIWWEVAYSIKWFFDHINFIHT